MFCTALTHMLNVLRKKIKNSIGSGVWDFDPMRRRSYCMKSAVIHLTVVWTGSCLSLLYNMFISGLCNSYIGCF